ncbi:MAG: hypothetical protein ACKOED_15815 [Aestuariivirga sp.]|uniref:hypothetical protein n=1 Tax=Aestuariivirga sp. TaxID=2650926 RepID=UPI0038D18B2C
MRDSRLIINRCQAVAAHGKRCRQTPYMTSSFCWHHTARADREALRAQSMRGDEHSKELAERIVTADLSREQIARIEGVLAAESAA